MNERQLAKDFLRLYSPIRPLSAQDATGEMVKTWGIRIDWHEFAYAIDELKSRGVMKPVGTNFYQKYQYIGA